MYLIESKVGAIACLLLSLVFLGSWGPIMAGLERRGRLPQHTYLDYSITNLLAAIILALTFGQIGESKLDMPNFLTQLYQDNWPSVFLALAGGVVLTIGNISQQYAWALVGVSVSGVVSMSLSIVIGDTLNYFLDGRINKAEILFPGVGCFLIAALLGCMVHKSDAADNKAKLNALSPHLQDISMNKEGSCCNGPSAHKVGSIDLEASKVNSKESSYGTATFLAELEKKRSIKVLSKGIWIGMGVTCFSGLCISIFSPLFNMATNDPFNFLKKGEPHLVVYTAYFYFSISFFVISTIVNVILLYHPVLGSPKSSIKAYLRDWDGRRWACLAGFLCGLGNGLQFMTGQAVGYAAASAVQASPLVNTFWGVVALGDYIRSSKRTYVLLATMLFMFIAAAGFLAASSAHRK